MTLPPEILDKILEHIPLGSQGPQTLIACTLVATWWTGPSQRRLFSSVSIYHRNYQRWMDGVVFSESKAHLLEYVRSLQHWRAVIIGIRYSIRNLSKYSGEYLSAMHNIYRLVLGNIIIEHISKGEFRTCFSAFRETLVDLTLDIFNTSFSALVALVDYFPNLTTLRLGLFDVTPDEEPVPALSRPLRGRIHISCISRYLAGFFDRLAKLDPEYEELILDSGFRMNAELVERVFRLGASTIRCLRLTAKLEREHPLRFPLHRTS